MSSMGSTFESYRLGGTEVEHDVFDPQGRVDRNALLRVLMALADRWGVRNGSRLIDEAGGLDYADVSNKAEHGTPEFTNGRAGMLYEKAGSVRWAIVAHYLDVAMGRPPTTWILKTNTNYNGDSGGGNHLNFLMPGRSDTSLSDRSAAIEMLKTFVVTLELLVGAGVVIPRSRAKTRIQGENYGFAIGARGLHVVRYAGVANTSTADGNKPVFMDRYEPLADLDRFWRMMISGLDSNILPSVIVFKLDVLFLMAEMAIRGAITPIQLYEPVPLGSTETPGNVCRSMRKLSCDWKLHLSVAEGPAREMTAREIQLQYFGQADKYVHSQPEPDPDQLALLDQWRRLLDGFDTDEDIPMDCFGLSDWVTKAARLKRREEKAGRPLTYDEAERIQFDYHGYRFRAGQRCTPLRLALRYGYPGIWRDIVRAGSTPPQDTRAWGRGQAVKLRPTDLNADGWVSMKVPGMGAIRMDDPRVPVTEALRRQLLIWTRQALERQNGG